MNWETVATVALGLVAFLGLLAGMASWLYKRGAAEKGLTTAMDQNTAAVEKLSGHMEKVTDKLGDHDVQLADHNARLKAGGL
jgi:hypothetical protein